MAQRNVLLTGSVPLPSAEAVFKTIGADLRGFVKRIPDGETGARNQWIIFQADWLREDPRLEPLRSFEYQGGLTVHQFKLKEGQSFENFELGPLGYAANALASYKLFKAAKDRGEIAPDVRFQVSVPTALATAWSFFDQSDFEYSWPAYERGLIREVQQVADAIPHSELAVQWDIVSELVYYMEARNDALSLDQMSASIARCCDSVPADVEVGLHLCYGDPGHKHLVEPKDLGNVVTLCNAVFTKMKRQMTWIHMPVPDERDDAAYFAPLKALDRNGVKEVYLGLVHTTDGVDGAKRRIATAARVIADFGIATECGWGRRPPETLANLINIHKQAAQA